MSWFSDYQARRAGIRYRVDGGNAVAHTLNGSALAVPRVWAALVETYRTDGRRRRRPRGAAALLPGRRPDRGTESCAARQRAAPRGYRPRPMPVALSTAQTLFTIALAVVALAITAFAVYVVSTVVWADRWVRRRR